MTDTGNQNDNTNSENSSENQNSKKNYKENKLASDSNSIKTSYQKDSLKQPITGQDLLPSINSSCLSVNGDNEVSGVNDLSVVDGVEEDKETRGKFTELRNKKESGKEDGSYNNFLFSKTANHMVEFVLIKTKYIINTK